MTNEQVQGATKSKRPRNTIVERRGNQASSDPQPLAKKATVTPVAADELPVGDTRPASIAELQRLAEGGDAAAASLLGDHYKDRDVASQDVNLAFHWYSRGAELGDREAQNNLGSMLLNGLGCERDLARAIDWYRKSAEQGQPIAQYNLAKRYLHGDGIDQDYAEARKWFEKATIQGEIWATCELGTMYRFGKGVERNLLAAADFHLIAAEAGDDVAWGNIAEYRAELEEVALSGSQLASLFLSRIYNRGLGVDKSQPMTWAWISWAKQHCSQDVHTDTTQEVGEAYDFYHMCITLKNRKEGQRLLKNLQTAHSKRTGESRCAPKRAAPTGIA